MATVTDYSSLTQAIADYTHRSDLTAGGLSDYFIQDAQEKINADIFEENFGNGIRFMETSYGPYAITGAGVLQAPADLLSPKNFQCAAGGTATFPLIFKAASWIYDTYPIRQQIGFPTYIARDVMPASAFTGVIAGTTLTVSGFSGNPLQVGSPIDDVSGNVSFNTVITAFGTGTGGNGTYTVSNSQSISSEAMIGGGSVFIFGPSPDSSYSVFGTYYQKAALLSGSATTNWMVLNCPTLLLAACMRAANRYIKDLNTTAFWKAEYDEAFENLVNADKAERWAASTMQVETG